MLGNRSIGAWIVAVIIATAVVVPAPPVGAATPLQVYPLGDSITFGYTPGANTPGGYRTVLDAELAQAGLPHRMVGTSGANPSLTLTASGQARHDGHNGYRIDQVASNLDGVAGAYDDRGGHWLTGTATRPALHPDVVLVHLGTNDIVKRFDPSNTYDDADPLDEAEERQRFVGSMTGRLRGLVDKALALRPGATVLVATVIPLATGTAADAVPGPYAAAVRDMVEHHPSGGRVRVVDAHRAFLTEGRPTPGLLSPDGAHPTPAGYTVLGEAFADAVISTT